MATNPFRVFEEGQPGQQKAVAEFTCPKCTVVTRFTAESEDAEGGFTCPSCGLDVRIRGARLSEYQRQLELIDAQLVGFGEQLGERLRRAAREAAEAQVQGSAPDDEPVN